MRLAARSTQAVRKSGWFITCDLRGVKKRAPAEEVSATYRFEKSF
jgi:hypothetical protein